MWSQVTRIKCMNMVDQVLNIPGNYSGDNLEMAFVFDSSIEKEVIQHTSQELIKALKGHGEIFRNVRLNTLYWKNNKEIRKEVTPMPLLQMGEYFNTYQMSKEEKTLDELAGQLKMFYARAKLIFIFTKGNYQMQNVEQIKADMKPFLGRKIIWIIEKEDNTDIKTIEQALEKVIPFKPIRVIEL